MAQAQVLHHRRNHNNLRQAFSSTLPEFQYASEGYIPINQLSNILQDNTMAQSLLQRQYRPDVYTQSQRWPLQQGLQADSRLPATTSSDTNLDGFAYQQGRNWGSALDMDNPFAWDTAMHAESYTTQDFNGNFRRNDELVYNDPGTQIRTAKEEGDNGSSSSWLLPGMSSVPRGTNETGSEPLTDTSLSPNRQLNDGMGLPFSPASMADQASLIGSWSATSTSLELTRGPSPKSISSEHAFGMMPLQKVDSYPDAGYTSFLGMNQGMLTSTVPQTGARHQCNGLSNPFGSTGDTSSEYSYSQGSSPGVPSWYAPGYARGIGGLSFEARDSQALSSVDLRGPASASSSGSDESRTPFPGVPPSRNRDTVPEPEQFQNRFQTARSADAEAQRQLNDNILVQGKRDGLTYKEIRKKMVGEKPAESTLRGRFRSLTKARKDRVRKPTWTKRDIELLKTVVEQEFERIDNTISNPHALSLEQRLVKVPWKKVAVFISENGGSYHFGNSTCKRKWMDINPNSN